MEKTYKVRRKPDVIDIKHLEAILHMDGVKVVREDQCYIEKAYRSSLINFPTKSKYKIYERYIKHRIGRKVNYHQIYIPNIV